MNVSPSLGANPKTATWARLKANLSEYRVSSCIGVQPRLEISDLAKDEWQFNLFLLAFQRLQEPVAATTALRNTDLGKDWLSYFHIAGLHGCPTVDWAEVPQDAGFWWMKENGPLRGSWVPRDQDPGDWANDIRKRIGEPQGGYCVHGSPLFLIWHRPYLALLEQMIAYTAYEIANEWAPGPERNNALVAAEKLRFPYWDLCRPVSGDYSRSQRTDPNPLDFSFPAPLSVKFVRVRKPNEARFVHIPNPLYQYEFPLDSTIKAAFAGIMEPGTTTFPATGGLLNTLRDAMPADPKGSDTPRLKTLRNATKLVTGEIISQHDVLGSHLNIVVDIVRQRTYQTFTLPELNFVDISCSFVIDKTKNAVTATPKGDTNISFEAIHDDYHSLIAGTAIPESVRKHMGGDAAMRNALGLGVDRSGTMVFPQVSAFDPAFWLMHCWYEFVMCTYQTMWPDKYWKNEKIERGGIDNCVWIGAKSTEMARTPLIPFKTPIERKNGWFSKAIDYWDTKRCEDWTQFGYTYKNLPSNYAKPANPAATNAAFARTMVNILFGWKRENDKAHELRTIYPIVDHSDYNWYPQMKDGEVLGDTTKPEDLDEDKKQPYVVVEHHALVGNVVHDKPMMASFRRLESTGLTATSVSANTVRSDRPSAIVKKTEETISVVDKGNDTKAETASKQETAAHPTISQPLDRRFVFPASLERDGKMRHWDLNFVVKRFALNGPFRVHVFLGDFSPDHNGWLSDPHHVHASTIWVRKLTPAAGSETTSGSCANCARQATSGDKYGDLIPLTSTLISFAQSHEQQPPGAEGLVLDSLEPDDVVPFLKRNLHWRVTDLENNVVAREDTPGLLVYVTSRTMEFPKTIEDLPVWGDVEVYRDITHARPAGLCHEEPPAEDAEIVQGDA